MNSSYKESRITEEQLIKLNELVKENDRDVPNFYEEGICESFYIPVEEDEIRIFHYKPKKAITKRPILFVPGFSTTLRSWKDFAIPLYEKAEYYFLETREKASSKIAKRFKSDLTIERSAKDINLAIKQLGLDKQDFVLYGASYCGGIILQGLIDKTIDAPTAIVFDPLCEWIYYKNLVRFLSIFPVFVIRILRMLLARIILIGMKNQRQKERALDFVRGTETWKWKRASLQNFKYNNKERLQNITDDVFLFHGPHDRHHPSEIYEDIALRIPKGRYIYTPCEEDKRELMNGIIALKFAKVLKNDKIPKSLAQFEIKLR